MTDAALRTALNHLAERNDSQPDAVSLAALALQEYATFLEHAQGTPNVFAQCLEDVVERIAQARNALESMIMAIAMDSRREPRMPVSLRLMQRGAANERSLYLGWRLTGDSQKSVDADSIMRARDPKQLPRFYQLERRITQAALIQTTLAYLRRTIDTHVSSDILSSIQSGARLPNNSLAS